MSLNSLSFGAMMYGGVVGFFLLTLIIVFGFMLGKVFDGKRFRNAALIAHTVLIVAVGLLVKSSGGDAMSGMEWLIPLTIDVALWIFMVIFGGFAYWGFGFVCFGLFIVGGVQWYFVGYMIDRLWGKASHLVAAKPR